VAFKNGRWREAKRKCCLSWEEVRMARELGYTPNGLIEQIPKGKQARKAPVKQMVRELHEMQRNGDFHPDWSSPVSEWDWEDFAAVDRLYASAIPMLPAATSENSPSRIASEWMTFEFAQDSRVEKVILFGPAAIADNGAMPDSQIHLAVWISDVSQLPSLQDTVYRTFGGLEAAMGLDLKRREIELSLLEPDTDRYLGRLCRFPKCPAKKPECRVTGCGDFPFLQQLPCFRFPMEELSPDRSVVLFDRKDPGSFRELSISVKNDMETELRKLRRSLTVEDDVPF
jgi:hypothetical protein